MQLLHSASIVPDEPAPEFSRLLETIDQGALRAWVTQLAVPRHYNAEPERNRATADQLQRILESFGYRVEKQGEFANVVGLPTKRVNPTLLVGAHYDSVPRCPGADDNASALAAMLGCAQACSRWSSGLPIAFVAFNREEDGFIGSQDFVQSWLASGLLRIRCAHVLEMVGCASSLAGSQRVPTGLPISLSEVGDFLGLLANAQSGRVLQLAMREAKTYVPGRKVTGLEVEQGFERLLPVLARSDHVPFWTHGIPALMWTDTAEFRNPFYHRDTDTPEKLDYEFLRDVTQILTATVIAQAGSSP